MYAISTWGPILLLYLIVSFVFQLIKIIDRRVKNEGQLFSPYPSTKSRIFALLVALLLGSFFLLILIAGAHISVELLLLPIASLALIAYSLGMNKSLVSVQNTSANFVHFANFEKRKEIIGITQMPFTEIEYKVRNGARFVSFEYCISPLIITLDYESSIYFIESSGDTHRLGLRYMLISLLFGWFNFFGPINTIRCLISYFRGGKDVTSQVVLWLKWRNQPLQPAIHNEVENKMF